MSVTPWLLILLTVYSQTTAAPHSHFVLSSEEVTWSEAMDQCLREGRPVRGGDVDHWVATGPPEILPMGVSVWIEAQLAKTLLWKNKSGKGTSFFQLAEKCYYKTTEPGGWNQTTKFYSPLYCFLECGERHTGRMYLQGDRCCCQKTNKKNCESIFPKCYAYSGYGTAPGYTVYDYTGSVTLSEIQSLSDAMEKEEVQLCFVGKFRTNDSNRTRLVVSGTQCDKGHSVVCTDDEFTPTRTEYYNETVDYADGAKKCLSLSSFPSKRQPISDRQFLRKLFTAVHQNLTEESFWLDLSIEPELFLTTGEQFEQTVEGTRDSGCVAMRRNRHGSISLRVRSCKKKLAYLCSSETLEQNAANNREHQITEAMVAGITGVLFLFIFCVVAVNMYVLKRMGYLRVRNQKPAFNSTGEWDRTDDGARSRSARQNKQFYIDELQSRLSAEKERGGASPCATTPVSHGLADPPSTASTRAPIPVPGPQDAEPAHIYDRIEELRLQQPPPLEEPGYSQPLPLTGDHPCVPSVHIVHQLSAGDAACHHLPHAASEQRELLHQIRHAVDIMINTMDRPTAASLASSGSSSTCLELRCDADVHVGGDGGGGGGGSGSAGFLIQPRPACEITLAGGKHHDDVRLRHGDDEAEDQQRHKEDGGGEYFTLELRSPLKADNVDGTTTTTSTSTTTRSKNADNEPVSLAQPLKLSPQKGGDVRLAVTAGSDARSRDVNCLGDTGDYSVLRTTLTDNPGIASATPPCADHTPTEAQCTCRGGNALPPDEKANPEAKSEQEKIAEASAGSELTNAENPHQTPAWQTASGDLHSSRPSPLDEVKNPAPDIGGDDVIADEGVLGDDVSSTPAHAGPQVSSRKDEARKDEVVVVSLKTGTLTG